MRREAIGVLCVTLLSESVARANPPPTSPVLIWGSDTMYGLTQDVIERCNDPNPGDLIPGPLAPVLSSVGGGSRNGAGRVNPNLYGPSGDQQIVPMTRFLSSEECSSYGTNRGQGVQIGLNGIGLFQDANESSTCRVLRYAGCMAVQDLNNRDVLGYGNGVVGLDDGAGSPVLATYCFSHWADVLRIIYTGQHNHVNDGSRAVACGPNDTFTSFVSQRRCNSDVRRTLVESWSTLFDALGDDGAGGCASPHCTRLRHAYRLDDYSGITDTFLALIGAPALGTALNVRTFCNGLENEDLDPIRRPCNLARLTTDDPDTVCAPLRFRDRNAPFGADGSPSGAAGSVAPTPPPSPNLHDPSTWSDLGLVLPISLPADRGAQYDETFCSDAPAGGSFRFAQAPNALAHPAQRCPDGNARVAGLCRAPVGAPGSARAGLFNCKSRRTNRVGGAGWSNYDARVYNLVPRDPVTGVILQANSNAITDPRWAGAGHYRIAMSWPQPSATAVPLSATHPSCREPTATQQIGCLVQADPCSIGFAGLQASAPGRNEALLLRAPLDLNPNETAPGDDLELGPGQAAVSRLLDVPGAACEAGVGSYATRYPLSHFLWLNSALGFGGLSGLPSIQNWIDTDPDNDGPFHEKPGPYNGPILPDGTPDWFSGENDFARCYIDRVVTDPQLVAHGFIPLPGSYAGASRLRQCQ